MAGLGAEALVEARLADPPDLFEGTVRRATRIENAMDEIRTRMGRDAIARGRGNGWSDEVEED